MFLTYIKLSLRLMARSPFFTLINVFGLGIAFASFFALWDFSTKELKSDQYHKDFERIVRIGWDWKWSDDGKNWDHQVVGSSKSDIPVRAKEDFPEVEDFTRIHTQIFFGNGLVPHGPKVVMSAIGREDRVFKEQHVIYADPNLFNFFSIPLIYGNADNVLADGGSVVLSESQAVKYFDKTNPVGQLLKLNDSTTLKVTGVFEDLPHNTHLTFNTVISNKNYLQIWATAFNSSTFNYIKLKEGASLQLFAEKLNRKKGDYHSAILQLIHNTEIDFFVQPLEEIVFGENLPGDEFTFRSKSLLIIFATVSVVLLAMAWINYVNLWIARNKKREKELATRKINGARGKDFILQFLTESALVNLLALLLAITILQFVKTPFQYLFNIQIHDFWMIESGSLVAFALAFVLSIAITGLYPAVKATGNHPLTLFKKQVEGSGRVFSASLVVIQYSSAIALILWSSIVYFELNHIMQQEIGLDRENVIVVEVPDVKDETHHDGFINRLSSHPTIEKIASSVGVPGEWVMQFNTRTTGSLIQVGFEWNGVNENYLPLYGLKLLSGRPFVQNDRDDVAIISEAATYRLGFKDPAEAVGTTLEVLKSEGLQQWVTVEIVGIVADFRSVPFFATTSAGSDFDNEFQSKGNFFTYKNGLFKEFQNEKLSIKLKPGSLGNTIAALELAYNEIFPGTPLNWFFLEDHMNKVYSNEKITRNQIALFVILAVVIACLGFQGMIAHKVTSKTKEIGIRKILGAGIAHIATEILKPSSIQFAVAVVIGMPIAWYLGNSYLQKFSERITLQWWHYAMPLTLLILIMCGTVATLLWKAVKSNPVEALKHE